jgi:hypothetical protein
VRSFLVQPALLTIVLTDAKNQQYHYRIVPEMSASGFLIHPLLQSNQDFDDFVQGGAFRSVRSIRFEPRVGSKRNWSVIELEFWQLPELKLRPSTAVAGVGASR